MTRTGIDRLLEEPLSPPGEGRIALLCNASTVSSGWRPTAEAIHDLPGLRLERIFSPQHGFAAERQDNMVESADCVHPRLGVPIVSLYGTRREPEPDDLNGIDLLLIDLQDVGTRVYTFLVTALYVIRTAAASNVPVVVLDRPNPIGGAVEGPLLEDRFRSFVGIVDVPLRHGLTAGEFCIYGAWRLGLIDEAAARRVAARARGEVAGDGWLRIVPLDGWRRSLYHDETGLPWTMPSPNMPALETAIVYPGQVALEGTNLSEGRGTTRPFEIFGAPYLDPQEIVTASEFEVTDPTAAGAMLREITFEPTFHKHVGEPLPGFQIHVLDRDRFQPVRMTTSILAAVRRACPDAFAWRDPPYEYEYDRLPIDLIYGTDRVRLAIEAGTSPAEIARDWAGGIAAYRDRVRPLLIYED